jgi:O-antigen ligase
VYKNLQQYHANGDIDTSLGARIEMWKVAGDIFKENPILGAGADEFRSRLQEGIKSSRYSKIYNGFSEPHSAYVTALSSRGLLGFLALLALIIVPLHAFSKGLRDQQQRNLAVTGITFILIFAVLGLSASVFETPRLMTFFSFYLAVIFSYFSDIKQTGA